MYDEWKTQYANKKPTSIHSIYLNLTKNIIASYHDKFCTVEENVGRLLKLLLTDKIYSP